MKKYLITGGAGFIGSNLCKTFLDRGYKIMCLDDLSTGNYRNISSFNDHPNFEFFKHDLTKPFFPDKLDGIFNLACPASPVHYQYNPIRTLKMGTLAIYNVLGMAARLKIPILQASTSEIYGDPKEHPQSESYWGNVNPIGPRACYDEGKRVAEALFIAYKNYNNVSIRIARIFNTYGPFMDHEDGRVVCNFIIRALKGENLIIYGDGSQTRSFCYVDDLVEGLIKLMDSEFQNPINLGNPQENTVMDLAKLIIDLTGSSSDIDFNPLPVDDPKRRCPEISKAKSILGWQPDVELIEGLNLTIDYFKSVLD